ncbi:MAG: hypothetical protein AB8I08_12540 [Sandaracinaceae bacterium]
MRVFSLLCLSSIVVFAGVLLTPVAYADGVPTCEEIRPGLVRCTETHIEGRRGPSGFYVLGRSEIDHPPTPLRRPDHTASVRRSVQRRPF